VTPAYGVPVVGGGSDTTEGLRSRVVQGRPNWWVILAVSLALMALLVATSGSSPHPVRRGGAPASATAGGPHRGDAAHGQGGPTGVQANAASTSTTSVPPPAPVTPTTSGPSLLSTGSPDAGTPPATGPSITTTTGATTTTTTAGPAASQPADRMQTQGYLDPPLQTSNGYGFTGTGAMQISVLWSGTTYLTMSISCPNGNQNVGGTSAMEASLPDATGDCRATVSEPSSETAALTYTITIGPGAGG
jgi:hypothetical protein